MSTPLTLTRRGLAFTLAAIGLWVSWLVIGLRDVWYLVALLAALVVVSVLSVIVLTRLLRPELRISVTEPTPTVGDEVEITATVRSRRAISFRAEVLWQIGDERISTPLLAGDEEWAVGGLAWKPHRRGIVEIRATLRLNDPLGLALRPMPGSRKVEELVLPRPLLSLSATLEADRSHGSDGPSNRPQIGQGGGTPSGTLRAYRTGDPLRQVHWKQSARQGELLVNQDEQSDRRRRSLLLDTDRDAYRSEADFDLAVSAAAALAERWLRQGQTVDIYLGGELIHCDREIELLRALALAEPDTGQDLPSPSGGELISVLVTGILTEHLSESLHQDLAAAGTVYTVGEPSTGESSTGQPPDGWRMVVVPAPDSRATEGASR